jgi:hypothetical protein
MAVRSFCPSCHQKRVVEFGEWICIEVIKSIPHRHVVLSIPKILWRYFLYDRNLLSDLSRCGWESLKALYTVLARNPKAVPGAVVAIQTFGEFPDRFHPHLHVLASDGCFHANGMFSVSPAIDTKALERIFRHKVLRFFGSSAFLTLSSSWISIAHRTASTTLPNSARRLSPGESTTRPRCF